MLDDVEKLLFNRSSSGRTKQNGTVKAHKFEVL